MVRAVLPPGPGRAEAAWNRICCLASSGSPQKESALGRAPGPHWDRQERRPCCILRALEASRAAGPSGQGCLSTVSGRPSPGSSSGPPLLRLFLPLDLWVCKGPSSPRHTPFRGTVPRHRRQTSNSKMTGRKGGCTAPPHPHPTELSRGGRCSAFLPPGTPHPPHCHPWQVLRSASSKPLKPQRSWGGDQGVQISKGPPNTSGIEIHNMSMQYFLKIKLLQKIRNDFFQSNRAGFGRGECSGAVHVPGPSFLKMCIICSSRIWGAQF